MSPEQTEAIWSQTLELLRGEMTKAAYSTIFPASRLVAENGDWIIELKDQYAVDWADHRLRLIIERALGNVVGQAVPVIFAVAKQNAPMPPPEIPVTSAASLAEPSLAALDYRKLWFGEGTSGFAMRPHYVEKFWQAYLGRAYSLWSLLQSDNRQNKSNWTRAKKYRYKYLARSLRCGFATIHGGLRPCNCFEKSKERGEPLTECCGRYHPAQWDYHTAEDNRQCLHWNPGLLEQLYGEGLLAIEVKAAPNRPNSHVLQLQVWTLLPVLTPKQVATLSEAHQLEHERWLEHIARQAGFGVEAWESLTAPTLVSGMAGYDQGRTLFDAYRPNPLLDTCGTNSNGKIMASRSLLDTCDTNRSLLDTCGPNSTKNETVGGSLLDTCDTNRVLLDTCGPNSTKNETMSEVLLDTCDTNSIEKKPEVIPVGHM